MDTEQLLKIAASLARGVNPETGAPLEDQRVAMAPKTRRFDSMSTQITKQAQSETGRSIFSMSEEQQALVNSVAEANASRTLLLGESEFLSKKRAEFSPSLRALGAEDGERWLLVKLQWTVEYWRERALSAEAALRDNT